MPDDLDRALRVLHEILDDPPADGPDEDGDYPHPGSDLTAFYEPIPNPIVEWP